MADILSWSYMRYEFQLMSVVSVLNLVLNFQVEKITIYTDHLHKMFDGTEIIEYRI